MAEIEKAIARIFSSDRISVVGAAFLVGNRQLLTCTHVIYAAYGVGQTKAYGLSELPTLYLDFPLVEPKKLFTAKASILEDRDKSDIAGMELTVDPPEGVKPVKLGIFNDVWGHTFRAFGFPRGYTDGVWTSGKILAFEGSGKLQIQGDQLTGYGITQGFSGSPIWDENFNCVVGMVTAVDMQENRKSAFGIPSNKLLEAWPALVVEQELVSRSSSKPRIYVSATPKERNVALEIKNKLLQNGFEVLLSPNSQVDNKQGISQIHNLLERPDRLILLLTPETMNDKTAFYEWFYFYSQKKPIHCLMVERCELQHQLLSFKPIPWANDKDHDWTILQKELTVPFIWPSSSQKENVIQSSFAPQRSLPESLNALHSALIQNEIVAVSPEQIKEIKGFQPKDILSYRLIRYSQWCGPKYRLDERFVRLTMIVDKGEEAENRWEYQEGHKRFDDLREVLNQEESAALVLLGAPGAGKSTLLRRMEMDISSEGIRDLSDKITFFVSLAEYGVGVFDKQIPLPIEWLSNKWEMAYPFLPPLKDLLVKGKVLLLLDSLNEISHSSMEEYRQRIEVWRAFVHAYIRDIPGNRAIFACRSLDYGGLLSTKEFTVQQIRVEPMSRGQVSEYLTYYASDIYSLIWDEIESDDRLFELFRVPFLLQLLIDRVRSEGTVPKSKAELFSSFVRSLIRREILSDHPLLKNGALLTDREWKYMRGGEKYPDPFYLPDRGLLILGLTQLAYAMQEYKPGEDKGQIVIDYYDALTSLKINDLYKEDVIKAGCDLSLLVEENTYVKYYHQLMQEFFAARQLALHPNPNLVSVEWKAGLIQPTLSQTIDNLAYGDPLPLLEATGWEETTVMAAEMTPNPADLIEKLIDVNLPLAGRCVASPSVSISEKIKKRVSILLLKRMDDPMADLRARIAAGLMVGYLDDLRFDHMQGEFGCFLKPQIVMIPGGDYRIGSNKNIYPNETSHNVSLVDFEIGKYPVTNAEFALFIKSGGYENVIWWETDSAKTWRSGMDKADGPKQDWRERRRILQNQLRENQIRSMALKGKISSQQADYREKMARMSDEDFELLMDQWYPPGKKTEPAYWNDELFNNPSQPVVGVNWYEARAYCSWLSAQLKSIGINNMKFDLPSEIEWEAAAKSLEEREFAYGNEYSKYLCNTFESHIRRTTPIGVFPGGDSTNGCIDMTGNVFEWTRSEIKPYPYDQFDGRENLLSNDRKALRGGSWRSVTINARNSYRGANFPISRNFDYGFRLFIKK